jgi:hypothetical protein
MASILSLAWFYGAAVAIVGAAFPAAATPTVGCEAD